MNDAPFGPQDLERMAALLEATGDFRILRRLRALDGAPASEHASGRAVFLDVETTGLDIDRDAVIELAMIKFDYACDGSIAGVCDSFARLRGPGFPIPAEAVSLTGISDDVVAGAAIGETEVAAFLEDATLVVSHHAGFDRPFCEKLWPTFAWLPWACSLRDIDWRREGFEGHRLSQIAAGFGFFFDAHRAADDCLAGVEILSRRLPRSDRSAFAVLLGSALATSWRVWAEHTPYQLRGILKRRRYRWNSGEDGGIRAWFVDVPEDALEDELRFLRREIYGPDDVEIMRRRMTALERYSERC